MTPVVLVGLLWVGTQPDSERVVPKLMPLVAHRKRPHPGVQFHLPFFSRFHHCRQRVPALRQGILCRCHLTGVDGIAFTVSKKVWIGGKANGGCCIDSFDKLKMGTMANKKIIILS